MEPASRKIGEYGPNWLGHINARTVADGHRIKLLRTVLQK